MQAATAATVRHFERAQLDNFNGRLTELSSNATRKTSANKQCGGVSMWAAGLSGLGTYKGPDGFEYNNSGTSIGGDRCFGSGSTVAGFGVGYGREHSKLNGDGSVMRATAATGATYGSLQLIPSLRFSWVAGVNQIDSNFDRYISINKTFGHGKWSGKQYLSSGSIGHDIKFDQFFFVPFFKLDLSKLTLAPYAETGGGIYGLPDARRDMKLLRFLGNRINMQVNSEDRGLCARVQRGLASSSYQPGPLSNLEGWMLEFHNLLRERIPEVRLPSAPARFA